jgi:hypothetical protein
VTHAHGYISETNFEALIVNNTTLSDVQKFHYPVASLKNEAKDLISNLDTGIQDTYRNLAVKKLRQLLNTNAHNSAHKRQTYVLKNIKQKHMKGNATVTRANKGRTTVIIHSQHYNKKDHSFLLDNNFHILPQDPTKKYQTKILKTLQQSNQIIDKKQIKFLTQKKKHRPQP